MWAEDLSYAEIAAAAGIQPSSVGTLLRRAQDAFKKEYRPDMECILRTPGSPPDWPR